MNTFAGNITNVDQYRFVNSPTATTYNDLSKGENIRDYRLPRKHAQLLLAG